MQLRPDGTIAPSTHHIFTNLAYYSNVLVNVITTAGTELFNKRNYELLISKEAPVYTYTAPAKNDIADDEIRKIYTIFGGYVDETTGKAQFAKLI